MHNQHYNNAPNADISHLRTKTRQIKKNASRRKRNFLLFLIAIAIFAILFLTPLFDIRAVNVQGTNKVTQEQLEGFVQSVKGQNLFTVGKKKLCRDIATLPYVKNVTAKRKIYPPSLEVDIEERKAVAYIAAANGFVVVDEECTVLEVAMQPPSELAGVMGVSPKKPTAGQKMDIDEEEKSDIIKMCIRELGPISGSIRNIDVTDTENISFNYENRLSVICGSSIDFSDKISLFEEVMKSNRIASNARGTIDLSISGKAVHTP